VRKDKATGKQDGKAPLPFVALCLTIVAAIITLSFGVIVVMHLSNSTSSRREISFLRAAFGGAGIVNASYTYTNPFDREMLQINPNFVAWITVGGTPINYPVVRYNDNERYLNTSFYGQENIFGTLFMDYRNRGDFVPHIIIYGHNSRGNRKFSALHRFLEPTFLAQHNTITLTVNGRVVEYEIFSARLTNIDDPAYYLDFSYSGAFATFLERNSAPAYAQQIITLSTCVTGGHDDERLVVQGRLINNGG